MRLRVALWSWGGVRWHAASVTLWLWRVHIALGWPTLAWGPQLKGVWLPTGVLWIRAPVSVMLYFVGWSLDVGVDHRANPFRKLPALNIRSRMPHDHVQEPRRN